MNFLMGVILTNMFDNEKVMSRNHAVLHYREQRFFLEDTNSSNGTHVNDQRLQPYQVARSCLRSSDFLVSLISWVAIFYQFDGSHDLMGCNVLLICGFP